MAWAKQSGGTLVEVLTAVLVLALGVLGAAGLHVQTLRTAHEAGLRSAAVQIAGDLADRMRAHYALSQQESGNHPYLGFDYDAATSAAPEPASVPPSCYLASCTPAQFAAFDLHDLARRIDASLPDGHVRICRDAAPWNEERQSLAWDCEAAGQSQAPVVIKIGWRSRHAAPHTEPGPAIALVAHP